MHRTRLAPLLTLALTTLLPAQQSIQVADIDRSAQPCDNFYQFANGAWRAQNPIPASMDRWSRRWQAGENNKQQLQTILDEVSADPNRPKGTPAQVAGDFYAACTDTKSVDAAGITPLKPYFARINAIHDPASLQAEISTLQAIGINAPFSFGSMPNPHNPAQVIADIGSGGLGLPDRDYYLKPDKRFADARAGYLAYITTLEHFSGMPESDASADAQTILAFETALAGASLDNVALRDPHNVDHITPFATLAAPTTHFNWTGFFAGAHVPTGPVNIEQPAFLTELDHQLASTPLSTWRTYLRWQLLNAEADRLSQPFVDARFDFFGHALAGIAELKPRNLRCAQQTDSLVGEALGQEYVKRYFPPEAKQRATVMVTNILSAMHDTLENLTWMTPETKGRALEKLSAFHVKVGYPDHWKDYSSVKITRTAYLDDALNAARFDVGDDLATIGKPIDRSRWEFTPPASDASYNPLLNQITFPAGILQPPAFSVRNVDAANYGAIGVVIGHEVSHGFDDQGAQFDAGGRLDNWWTPADLEKFHTRTACVVQQFDSYTIDGAPDIHINGKLTLGESIGDLAGLKIAYLAFKKTPQGQSTTPIDGFTPDQQFFLAWGQFRGDETRPETQKMMVEGDPHPVAKYRVLGPMSNFPPFAAAFSCPAGSPMTRSDSARCVVW